MVKKEVKATRKKNRIVIVVAVIVAAVLIALISFFIVQNIQTRAEKEIQKQSQHNFDLMMEAQNKKDATICDQIKGGIHPKKQPKLRAGNVFENTLPELTESEARDQCQKNVQWIISHPEAE